MDGSKRTPLPPEPEGGDRDLVWLGPTEEVLAAFPVQVKRSVGLALRFAQRGTKHPIVEPLRGYGGAGVLEVIKRHDGDTYRAVYTVRFAGRLCVLHVFQKKFSSGIATPQKDIRLIDARLNQAQAMHGEWLARQPETEP